MTTVRIENSDCETGDLPDRGLPDDADILAYEAHGYHVTPEIVPHDLLDAVAEAVDDIQSGRRDRTLNSQARYSDWTIGDADPVRNNEFCSLQVDVVRSLVHFPLIGQIAARLARSASVRLFDDQLICKMPERAAGSSQAAATSVGWHTDGSYWSTCTSARMLTAWIPLRDTNRESGSLCVVEGSHLWDEAEHVRGFNDPELSNLGALIGRDVPEEKIVHLKLTKGQVSFHHMRALHASTPNRSERPRCAVALHMQDGENAYRRFHTPDGTLVVLPHDILSRKGPDGEPDYTDPDVFPRLWPPAHGPR